MATLDAFRTISLETLDERAALLKRVDTKYLLAEADLEALLAELAADHDVLEIDGRRRFAYRSVSFDTQRPWHSMSFSRARVGPKSA